MINAIINDMPVLSSAVFSVGKFKYSLHKFGETTQHK